MGGAEPHLLQRRLCMPMFDLSPTDDPDIARHEVSEDGVMWRPFDPKRDAGKTLHRRIEFAPPARVETAASELRPMPSG